MIKINNPGNAFRLINQTAALTVVIEETDKIMDELTVIASKLVINEKALSDALNGNGYRNEEAAELLAQIQESRALIQAIVITYGQAHTR